jgi:hypothetical protein
MAQKKPRITAKAKEELRKDPPPLDFRVLAATVRSGNSVLALCCEGRITQDDAERLNEHLRSQLSLDPMPGRIFVLSEGVTIEAALDAEVVDHGIFRFDTRKDPS